MAVGTCQHHHVDVLFQCGLADHETLVVIFRLDRRRRARSSFTLAATQLMSLLHRCSGVRAASQTAGNVTAAMIAATMVRDQTVMGLSRFSC